MNLANNITAIPIKTEVIILVASLVFPESPCEVINTQPAQIINTSPAYKETVNNRFMALLTIAQIFPAPTGFSNTTKSFVVVAAV